jgi:hypothetical protein
MVRASLPVRPSGRRSPLWRCGHIFVRCVSRTGERRTTTGTPKGRRSSCLSSWQYWHFRGRVALALQLPRHTHFGGTRMSTVSPSSGALRPPSFRGFSKPDGTRLVEYREFIAFMARSGRSSLQPHLNPGLPLMPRETDKPSGLDPIDRLRPGEPPLHHRNP